MPWLLIIGAVAVGAWLLSQRPRFVTYQADNGTWTFGGYVGSNLVYTDPGPYASQAAAAAAGAAWVAQRTAGGAVGPAPEPIDLPPPQQGDAPVQPPAPPAAPYLVVRSPPVSGDARVIGGEVRWSVYTPEGTTTDTTANAMTANATMLERVNNRAPLNNAVRIELRRANGTKLISNVTEVVQGWRWTLDTPPPGPGQAGSSVSQPGWVANNRLAAMRAAVTTLQNA